MAVRQDNDAVDVFRDLLHAVAHKHNGRAALAVERANVGKQFFPALRVKSRARLIEHEHFGFHRNDARDGHAALLSA